MLEKIFQNIGYTLSLFHKYLKLFLTNVYEPKIPMTTVPKQTIYFPFPYLGYITDSLYSEITKLINKSFPQLNLRLAFTNSNSIFSFFKHAITWISYISINFHLCITSNILIHCMLNDLMYSVSVILSFQFQQVPDFLWYFVIFSSYFLFTTTFNLL